MIRLEIEGCPVALDENFSLDICDYNAIFDVERNRGAFTYDIDINLRQEGNARLYNHIQRINGTSVFTDRNVCLYVGGLPFLTGKEIVLECNGEKAKIQIVGGNSEVNAEGSSLRISDLDLGQLPEYTAETALASVNAAPLTVPAVCTPVMVDYMKMPYVPQESINDKMVNMAEYTDLWSENGSWHGSPTFCGQPYLVVVIERVLQALGWKVTDNILRTMEYAKRLIIIHGYETRNICEILPNWTVNEFLEQVQRMFNVIFVTNEENRTVAVFNRNTFYEGSADTIVLTADDVIKDDNTPAIKYDSQEKYVYNYDSVKYDLPSKVYSNRADISDAVKEAVSLWYVSSFGEFNGPSSQYRSPDYYNSPFFFYHSGTNSKWMIAKGSQGQNSIKYIFVRVDQFAHARKSTYKEGDTETVIKIVPAETIVMSIHVTNPSLLGGAVVPYAQVSGKVGADFTASADMGLNQWVEGNEPKKKDTRSEKLYVAQYLGRTSLLADSHAGTSEAIQRLNQSRYPQVYTHRWIDGRLHGLYSDQWGGAWRDYIMDALWDKGNIEDEITFDLNKRIETTYYNGIQVNDKIVYTIKIKVRGRLDVTSIFNISGRRFVCVSLRYRISGGKLMSYAEGAFLPLR